MPVPRITAEAMRDKSQVARAEPWPESQTIAEHAQKVRDMVNRLLRLYLNNEPGCPYMCFEAKRRWGEILSTLRGWFQLSASANRINMICRTDAFFDGKALPESWFTDIIKDELEALGYVAELGIEEEIFFTAWQ